MRISFSPSSRQCGRRILHRAEILFTSTLCWPQPSWARRTWTCPRTFLRRRLSLSRIPRADRAVDHGCVMVIRLRKQPILAQVNEPYYTTPTERRIDFRENICLMVPRPTVREPMFLWHTRDSDRNPGNNERSFLAEIKEYLRFSSRRAKPSLTLFTASRNLNSIVR